MVELEATVVADGIVTCALGDVHVPGAPAEGTRGVIVLRPEQLAVVDERGVGAAPAHGAPGTVRSCSYHGHDSLLLVELAGGDEVPVRVPGGPRRPAGGPRAGRRRRDRPAVYTSVTAENVGIHTNR